ncbi:hypothetical protein CC78DRAFT_614979 [Lojkania enalia]|uniref:Uncharacterized protein n=1 Tax=Lojkania enalia TaxID=147567 RepID=A0A9P4N8T4_9PLEO|nr:hypothetical protein CC78DRAFT_614979 [Didymosphaeria enalia]
MSRQASAPQDINDFVNLDNLWVPNDYNGFVFQDYNPDLSSYQDPGAYNPSQGPYFASAGNANIDQYNADDEVENFNWQSSQNFEQFARAAMPGTSDPLLNNIDLFLLENNNFLEPGPEFEPEYSGTSRRSSRIADIDEQRKPPHSNSAHSLHNTRKPARSSESSLRSNASRNSSWSATGSEKSSLRKTRQINHRASVIANYRPEKPKMDENRPWVRINASTRGLTTRTAKINHYRSAYEDRPHPIGDWKSQHYDFKYTKDGEFKEKTMSARQIREFILQYPREPKHAKLKIWIQKGPTDSARRYPTTSWPKCRFRDCPAHIYQTGTILHGHYRVAFDEKWHRDRENVDPFLCAGYVHLYCMERFLDFPEICRHTDVEVDTRQLTNEPNGKFAASLFGQPECGIAQDFVDRCRRGKHELRSMEQFANYPRHKDFPKATAKPHQDTLTYWMNKIKNDSRPPAQLRQFSTRGLKPTHALVHGGDLDMLFSENIAKKAQEKQKNCKKRKAGSYDEDEEEFQQRKAIERKARVKETTEYFASKAMQKKRRTSRRNKRQLGSDDETSDLGNPYSNISKRQKRDPWDCSDDCDVSENEIVPPTYGSPVRRSSRITQSGQKPKYTFDEDEEIFAYGYAPVPGPALHNADLVASHFQHVSGTNNSPYDDPNDFPSFYDPENPIDERLFEAFLNRRKSSTIAGTLSRRTSILRSPSTRGNTGEHCVSFGHTSMHDIGQPQPTRRYSTRLQDKVKARCINKR